MPLNSTPLHRQLIEEQKEEISRLNKAFYTLKDLYDRVCEEIRPYREALALAPQKVKEFFKELFSRPEIDDEWQQRPIIRQPKLKKNDDRER